MWKSVWHRLVTRGNCGLLFRVQGHVLLNSLRSWWKVGRLAFRQEVEVGIGLSYLLPTLVRMTGS